MLSEPTVETLICRAAAGVWLWETGLHTISPPHSADSYVGGRVAAAHGVCTTLYVPLAIESTADLVEKRPVPAAVLVATWNT